MSRALFVSDELSRIVGAYAVIWVASTIGAYFALGTRDTSMPMSGTSSLVFFLAVNAVALLLTVPLAMLGGHLPARERGRPLAVRADGARHRARGRPLAASRRRVPEMAAAAFAHR